MPNAPRTVKDVPAQEFVVALAQYFRSTGKVRRVRIEISTRETAFSAGPNAPRRARPRRDDAVRRRGRVRKTS